MSSELKSEGKNNRGLTEIVQAKWEQVMKENGIVETEMSKEYLEILRMSFQFAYDEGQSDMVDEMKDIYNNDPDYFEYMFEDDNNRVLN